MSDNVKKCPIVVCTVILSIALIVCMSMYCSMKANIAKSNRYMFTNPKDGYALVFDKKTGVVYSRVAEMDYVSGVVTRRKLMNFNDETEQK